jgi:hypothetical protein
VVVAPILQGSQSTFALAVACVEKIAQHNEKGGFACRYQFCQAGQIIGK